MRQGQRPAHTRRELMRLVDQHRGAVTQEAVHALEPDNRIEHVVVVADDDVSDDRHVERQLERADDVTARHFLDALGRCLLDRDKLGQSSRRTFVVAASELADRRIAERTILETCALLGRDRHRAKRSRGTKPRDGVLRRTLPGATRGRVNDAIDVPLGHRLQRREQRAHRLAGAGRRHREQPCAVTHCAKHVARKRALRFTKRRVRKVRGAQPLIPRASMHVQLGCARRERPARLVTKFLQRLARQVFGNDVSRERIRVCIDHPYVPERRGLLVGEHRRIELDLREMHRARAGVQLRRIDARRLELLDERHVGIEVAPVDTTGQHERMLCRLPPIAHCDLAAISGGAVRLQTTLHRDALLRSCVHVVTRVDVATPPHHLGEAANRQRELASLRRCRAHQLTFNTRAAIPTESSNPSQSR